MSADSSLSVPDNGFDALGLPAELRRTLAEIGYESPSPIQAATIPPLLNGRDVLGQAQTGTGKTAAFALPTLARIAATGIHTSDGKPRALVLTPTRELAIQVAEAFGRYAAHMPGLRILAVYGGQRYGPQLQALRRGVEVVVGTPGRIIDHLERGCLDLSRIDMLVLDEADEMLRMGFIDDVEAVLHRLPEPRQVALFSATMPAPIKRIAQTCLHDPVEVAIQAKSAAAANIRQRHWPVAGMHKLDALTRILEVEPFDAMIVFTRTKLGAEELAEKLTMRGFAAAAINGDMEQKQRERTIQKLKDRQIDILVATDVAARGLDVERISHVLNYDIPYDTESYVHRIGRTGRAGRAGEAILFATPRERGMLRAIERATGQSITPMTLPSVEAVNARRVDKFMDTLTQALASPDLDVFSELVERYAHEHQVPAVRIAAALARRLQGDRPLLLTPEPEQERRNRLRTADPAPAGARAAPGRRHAPRERAAARPPMQGDIPLETFHIAVGHIHGVQPGNIVGAIANEAGLDSRHIGRIRIRDDHSLIELPTGMPRELLAHLKQVWVAGRQLQMRRLRADDPRRPPDANPGAGAPHRVRRPPPRRRR